MKKIICILIFFAGVIAFIHDVPSYITQEDREYIERIYQKSGLNWDSEPQASILSYPEQIKQIIRVQESVLNISPNQITIPKNHTREPKDLYEYGHGYCFDRARSMAKMYELLGYDVRYASIYSMKSNKSAFSVLTSRGGPHQTSHAAIEVKTKNGPVIVDSVSQWLSIDTDGISYSFKKLQNARDKGQNIVWDEHISRGSIERTFNGRFIYLYGVHSRHGRFYPPYNPIPDLDWQELLYNL